MSGIDLPDIRSRDIAGQLFEIKEYLYRLAEKLNYENDNAGNGGNTVSGDLKIDGVLYVRVDGKYVALKDYINSLR